MALSERLEVPWKDVWKEAFRRIQRLFTECFPFFSESSEKGATFVIEISSERQEIYRDIRGTSDKILR